MTELETMKRAKMYLYKLAQGIDPISNQEVPEDSPLNQVQLATCFFYVSDILGQIIANGGVIGGKPNLPPFEISAEQLASVPISQKPLRITQLVEAINTAVDNPQMKKLSTTVITNWLLEKGYLKKHFSADGKSKRLPTQTGMALGLFTQIRQGQHGEYQAVFYTPSAQKFVLDHLHEILSTRTDQQH